MVTIYFSLINLTQFYGWQNYQQWIDLIILTHLFASFQLTSFSFPFFQNLHTWHRYKDKDNSYRIVDILPKV